MSDFDVKTSLATTLKEAMSKKEINNSQLGNLINVDKSTVGRWLKGEKLLKVDVIPALCEALDITPNQLFGYVDKNTLSPKQITLLSKYEKSDQKDAVNKLLDIKEGL